MEQIQCNQCGKVIVYGEGTNQEDFLTVKKEWGYFSRKDLELHEFHLCEDCYDKLVQHFQVPICIKTINVVL
jgi:hypothetical protein